ncbi:MAG: hypothetical protein DBX59_01975 [Bacillota bacterium]|nr:MAG: hypothetical protein DBX59_01975 [Bacillota bacterium]
MKLDRLTPFNGQFTAAYYVGARPHYNANWEISLFIEGESLNSYNGTDFKAVYGSVFLTGTKYTHKIIAETTKHLHRDIYITDEEMRHFCAFYRGVNLYRLISERETAIKIQVPAGTFKDIVADLSSIEMLPNTPVELPTKKNFIDSIAIYLLSFIPKNEYFQRRNMPAWLDEFMQKLAHPENFTQKVYQLTAATGYSHSQLARIFKKYTGFTLFEYIDNLKLNYALTMLQTTEESVLDISITLGYDSLSYFIKRFKNAYGITPQKLRAMIKNRV